MKYPLSVGSIDKASRRLADVAACTPLQFSTRLSKETGARVYLKREDLQEVRSYKIRGAYNLMSSLTIQERARGIVCASAGNHAQGVALSCVRLKIKGMVFMPTNTPLQKISRVRHFGDGWTEIRLVGQNYDEACAAAHVFATKTKAVFVHPFDDERVMSGQGTVAKEIADQLNQKIDLIVCPVGGGGLIAGVGAYLKATRSGLQLVGAEPAGAASLTAALKRGRVTTLKQLDRFVDGAAVATVGRKTFAVAKKHVDRTVVVPEGLVCATMISLYQNEGIVAEPAGALSVAALSLIKKSLKNKTVVCILSGGNNDILRYPEIVERSLVYSGLKRYFLIEFAQKPGQLKRFINRILGPTDDISRFEYVKKDSRETGPALVGLEFAQRSDGYKLVARLKRHDLNFQEVAANDSLAGYVI